MYQTKRNGSFFFDIFVFKKVLNKALVSDDVKMDCETFAKEHRKLCSAQFMHLAMIRKIHAQTK
jgi:hypothetical protein